MYRSHQSYTACGLGSDGTDRLIELVQAAGPERGLFVRKSRRGKRRNGRGARHDRRGSVTRDVAARYAAELAAQRASSPVRAGAAETGVLRL